MEPGKAEHEYYTVLCESRLADLEVERREPSQAQENYRSAIQRTERLLARDSNNSSYLITLSYCSGRLGESLWRTDQPDEARQWLERRLEVNRRITSLEPRNLTYQAMVADACVKLSRVCLQSGRHEQASPLADEAIRLLRPLTEREAPNVALREALACSLSISGRAVLQSGDAPTAKNRLAEAQAVFGGLESNRPVNLYSLLDHAEALSVLAGLGAESAQPEVEAQHGQTAQSLFKAAADEATRIGDTALAERCMARTRTGQLGGGAGTP
jgi:tetratricopeptide (TPR) repeat protein